MSEQQIILGLHSIRAALANPRRNNQTLIGTKTGLQDLFKGAYQGLRQRVDKLMTVSSHQLQELAKKDFSRLEFHYSRVPSQVYLLSEVLTLKNADWLYQLAKGSEGLRILALDGVTDPHNAAAIMRTASFYGVKNVVISGKGRFGFSPGLLRIASGAIEFLDIIQVQNLAKTLNKLKACGVQMIGLSEHAEEPLSRSLIRGKDCLVMGTEDLGISHAVERVLDKRVALISQGEVKSLNVSVATAVSLEKCFGEKISS